ncbi:MAG: peptidylprolyl isomerase [Thermoprotei archaeon]|nr:MAG: peptidylprolyl isomerase [Thermoprotei archaeon]RLF23203.1 MAG: peptidylprolyl isomerase [Thermoprotei archaeon]
MPLEDGDFILVEYTAKVKDEDRVFETTDPEEAKKAGIYDESEVYGPRLVVLGEGWLLKGLEEELKHMEVGEEKEIVLPPEKAFGQRDPSKVRVMPARELTRRGIRLIVGSMVNIDGRLAVIRSVGSGRVVVDFNHPLAGRTIIYKVKVVKKLESPEEKIRELLRLRIPKIESEKLHVMLQNSIAEIKFPKEALALENIQLAKRALIEDIRRFLKNVKLVRFIEEFPLEEEEAKEAQGGQA